MSGTRCVTAVNGLIFMDYGKYDEGHISLQNHGTTVWYRDVKIKEL